MDNEPFSNPLAPPSLPSAKHTISKVEANSEAQPLTNADFRKLMMTPRVVSSNAGGSAVPGSVRGSVRSKHSSVGYNQKEPTNENLKKKKKFYESIKKQEDDVLSELAKKYRDRAKERRDGGNAEHGKSELDLMANTAYHAVGPGNFDMDAAERRKQMIQESKYLGGDMEHTHLVKGLDYALLHKVKAEIQTKDDEERYLIMKKEEEARQEEEQKKKSQSGLNSVNDITFNDSDRYAVKSKIAENILKSVFNKKLPHRNELFVQGRMAYQYDLVDEFPESDIPTTIIRSKAECPNLDAYNSISTNEIVVNKLVQIFTNFRQGGTASKKSKKPKTEIRNVEEGSASRAPKGDSIYDDIGDYVPSVKATRDIDERIDRKSASYFESFGKNAHGDVDYRSHRRTTEQDVLEMAASVVGSFAASTEGFAEGKSVSRRKSAKYQPEPDGYAECYPGAPENDDAIIDSDDEADYSKMDNSNSKKGHNLLNRWDFDSAEEYASYMSNMEATPKAAFQYGVKGGEGRSGSSKRAPSKKEEKAKLDRDLQKINQILAKRKANGSEAGMSYLPEEGYSKKTKR
ncbi:hypothetical protein TYRP_004493 [Tyrophagus putrescentiae]|nr:hypothetical protein TYRP_004493 [Tyrophagus putrescentiae]